MKRCQAITSQFFQEVFGRIFELKSTWWTVNKKLRAMANWSKAKTDALNEAKLAYPCLRIEQKRRYHLLSITSDTKIIKVKISADFIY